MLNLASNLIVSLLFYLFFWRKTMFSSSCYFNFVKFYLNQLVKPHFRASFIFCVGNTINHWTISKSNLTFKRVQFVIVFIKCSFLGKIFINLRLLIYAEFYFSSGFFLSFFFSFSFESLLTGIFIFKILYIAKNCKPAITKIERIQDYNLSFRRFGI